MHLYTLRLELCLVDPSATNTTNTTNSTTANTTNSTTTDTTRSTTTNTTNNTTEKDILDNPYFNNKSPSRIKPSPLHSSALANLDIFSSASLGQSASLDILLPPSLDTPLRSFPVPPYFPTTTQNYKHSLRINSHLHKQLDWRLGPIAVFWYDFPANTTMDPLSSDHHISTRETPPQSRSDSTSLDLQSVSNPDHIQDQDRHQGSHRDQRQGPAAAGPSNSSDPILPSSQRALTSGVFVPVASPSLGVNFGILHLYRDRQDVLQYLESKPSDTSHPTPPEDPESVLARQEQDPQTSPISLLQILGATVAILGVPPHIIPQEFLKLMGVARKSMSHLRIIRDSVQNRFIMLLKFRSSQAAHCFYKDFNGRPFNSFEPEICHVVYVKSVEFDSSSIPKYAFPPTFSDPGSLFYPQHCQSHLRGHSGVPPSTLTSLPSTSLEAQEHVPLSESKRPKQGDTLSDPSDPAVVACLSGENKQHHMADINPTSLLELPTCPVCLDRMDASVTGLLTIVCHHTFHCSCIMKWGDSSCPVCRYSSTKESDELLGASSSSKCTECASTDNLWICLICGSIGCGRYVQGHAFMHFKDTGHVYALELETQRVWDYAGDGYVHRLIQNRTDGKLVELPAPFTPSSLGGGAAHGSTSLSLPFPAHSHNVSNDALLYTSMPTPAQDGGVGYSHPPQRRRIMGLDTLDPHSNVTEQDAAIAEKVDALGLEYSHMLQSQLDLQRTWFERQINKVQLASSEHSSLLGTVIESMGTVYREVCVERDTLVSEANQHSREKRHLERRVEKLCERLDALERKSHDEHALNAGLQDNLAKVRSDLLESQKIGIQKDALISELQEQVRDIMFYLETQKRVDADPCSDELKNATVVGVADAPGPLASHSSSSTKRKGRKR
ncbi:hypothetical protein BASA83_000983 [Batrachochytrium salamandrivorans]|nr:hypothetical protein BASA81_004401 [Batrachochytrium salamandrivorans]KAH9276302.1 hypothetical protein BASA83_000983 [Batrachochytrium salamandrivorans]